MMKLNVWVIEEKWVGWGKILNITFKNWNENDNLVSFDKQIKQSNTSSEKRENTMC